MITAVETGEADDVLVRRAQAGDPEAFGRLVERYMRRAYYSALSLVGSREDALDISQEAFARAYRARRTIDPDRPAAREQAIDRMASQATARGANAVINVTFSTSYIMGSASEILAYGEAVTLEPDV
ncbi:hypothetical protein BH23ACI1_BH23ACI1_14430 [soil metagenome]